VSSSVRASGAGGASTRRTGERMPAAGGPFRGTTTPRTVRPASRSAASGAGEKSPVVPKKTTCGSAGTPLSYEDGVGNVEPADRRDPPARAEAGCAARRARLRLRAARGRGDRRRQHRFQLHDVAPRGTGSLLRPGAEPLQLSGRGRGPRFRAASGPPGRVAGARRDNGGGRVLRPRGGGASAGGGATEGRRPRPAAGPKA